MRLPAPGSLNAISYRAQNSAPPASPARRERTPFRQVAQAAIGAIALVAGSIAAAQGNNGPATAPPAASALAGNVIVQRTMMPESGASAFAVSLGHNLNFCYDPGRGGINYVWLGDFVDLEPTWKAKINAPAVVRGTIVYRETARWPLRLNQPEREPKYTFKGYSLLPDGVEFHYLLDEMPVREEIRALPEARGIVRRFQLGSDAARWWLQVGAEGEAGSSSPGAKWDPARQALTGSGVREFTVTLALKGRQP